MSISCLLFILLLASALEGVLLPEAHAHTPVTNTVFETGFHNFLRQVI